MVGLTREEGKWMQRQKDGTVDQWPWIGNGVLQEQRMREYTLSSIPSLHSWCNGHSISINVCGVQRSRDEIQVFKREFHMYMQLDQIRTSILYQKKKKKKNLVDNTMSFLIYKKSAITIFSHQIIDNKLLLIFNFNQQLKLLFYPLIIANNNL